MIQKCVEYVLQRDLVVVRTHLQLLHERERLQFRGRCHLHVTGHCVAVDTCGPKRRWNATDNRTQFRHRHCLRSLGARLPVLQQVSHISFLNRHAFEAVRFAERFEQHCRETVDADPLTDQAE